MQPQCHRRDRAYSGSPGNSATSRRLGEIVEQAVPEAGDEGIFKPQSSNRDRRPDGLVKSPPFFSVKLFQVWFLEPKHMRGKPAIPSLSLHINHALTEDALVPAR